MRHPRALGSGRRHAVYRLAPDLLLVFKPRGHREVAHAHPHRQRLRILRGRLRIDTAAGSVTLSVASPAFAMPAGRRHSTVALADTWLVAEKRPRRISGLATKNAKHT